MQEQRHDWLYMLYLGKEVLQAVKQTQIKEGIPATNMKNVGTNKHLGSLHA